MKNNTFILTINQNGQSGLIGRVQNSARSLNDAEKHVFDFVNILTYRDKFPITGNSVEAIQMFIEITCLCKLLEHLRESHPVDVAEVKKN